MSPSNTQKIIAGVYWPFKGEPTVGKIKNRYGFKDNEIDRAYGVIMVNPSASYYAFLVSYDAFNRVKAGLKGKLRDELTGPWSNPKVTI